MDILLGTIVKIEVSQGSKDVRQTFPPLFSPFDFAAAKSVVASESNAGVPVLVLAASLALALRVACGGSSSRMLWTIARREGTNVAAFKFRHCLYLCTPSPS